MEFFVFLFAGVLFPYCYDYLRIFRRIVKHGFLWVVLEDTIFAVGITGFLFLLLQKYNKGMFTYPVWLGMGSGALIYLAFVSGKFVSGSVWVIMTILCTLRDFFVKIGRKVLKYYVNLCKHFSKVDDIKDKE
ncbi:MAG: spore cortex biosynthesis protein YabQ [Lachnospiraceae bacterium]